ncbi:MAG: Uma2 family endonuclease [Cyanobacteriota bacterium]|nr:Uma2 family endonuclease [Cyanobacteriota bacterium]
MKTCLKWTVEEYHRLIDLAFFADRRVELLEGDLVEMPPEGPFQAFLTEGTAEYLRGLLSGLAWVREAHPISLPDSEPQPDIAIVQLPREQYRSRHPEPEEIFWLVEISRSTLDYDLNEKKQACARAKIPEYWVVNVNAKQLHVFREPSDRSYTIEWVLTEGAIVPLAFLEISVDIVQLLK